MYEGLAGRVALVTGASSGIGRATARVLGQAGVKMILVGRSADRLRDTAAQAGGDAFVIAADLSSPDEVERVAAEASRRFGRIDILLPNAGLYLPGDVAAGSADAWDELIAVNVNSVFRLVRAVLPGMIERKGGDIVVTSSISGHQAIHWEPVYSASKHAVQSFVHGLRRQVAGDNVRVGAIAPGIVLNELWGYTDPAVVDAKIAAREGLRSEDVADAILFMLTRPANVTIRDLVMLPQNQDI